MSLTEKFALIAIAWLIVYALVSPLLSKWWSA